MALPITSLSAGLLALLFILLSTLVIKYRMKEGKSLDVPEGLIRRTVRAHGNFAEYVPFSLLLMGLVELQAELPYMWLVILAGILILGRIAHAYSIVVVEEKFGTFRLRQFAMLTTFVPMVAFAVTLIINS